MTVVLSRALARDDRPLLPGDVGPDLSTPKPLAPIAINGRFLDQPVTGVQRYAREVTAALDHRLAREPRLATVVTSGGSTPSFHAMQTRRVGPFSGHLWEQATLPLASDAVLLNFCNTGPLMRRRQVVCIHDLNVLNAPSSYRRSFRLLYRTLQPLLARRAAVVTTVSDASARDIAAHLGLDRQQIAVLPNGHEHVARWNKHASMLRHSPLLRRPFVLTLGSRAKHKNLAFMLDLAEQLDQLGLDIVVAGGGADIFRGGADAAPGSLSNVQWLGAVTDDDLAFLFSRALCLAFPSLTEGFGLPVVEAMALGCPVVSSDRGSLPEVCGQAALIASPDDPVRWLSHIRALQTSTLLRDAMIGRGRNQARRFSWAATADGYLDLVDRLG